MHARVLFHRMLIAAGVAVVGTLGVILTIVDDVDAGPVGEITMLTSAVADSAGAVVLPTRK
jgi:hypothetical protein